MVAKTATSHCPLASEALGVLPLTAQSNFQGHAAKFLNRDETENNSQCFFFISTLEHYFIGESETNVIFSNSIGSG